MISCFPFKSSVSALCVPVITSKDHKGIEGVLTVVLLQGGEGLQDNVVY